MKKILLLLSCMTMFACTDDLTPVKVEALVLNSESLDLTVGESKKLEVTVLPDKAENKAVYWTSSNNEVASVNNGIVIAVAPGTAVITVISDDGGKKVTCTVRVSPKLIPVAGITLDKENMRLFLGEEATLIATVLPNDASNKVVLWKSSNQRIATVKEGVVSAVGIGEAIITAETQERGFKVECKITVTEECQTQTKGPVTLDLGKVTATTATLSGVVDIDMLSEYDMSNGGIGFIYSKAGQSLDVNSATKVPISGVDDKNAFSTILSNLSYDTEYQYTIYLYKNGMLQYGEVQYFKTKDVVIEVGTVSTTSTTATFTGTLNLGAYDSEIKAGIMCSTSSSFSSNSTKMIYVSSSSYTLTFEGLDVGKEYYYRTFIYQYGYEYGETKEFTTNAINVNLAVSSKTATTVTFSGKMNPVSEKSSVTIGVYVNTSEIVNSSNYKKMMRAFDSDIAEDGTFSVIITGLSMATQYYYTPFVYSNSKYSYGEIKDFSTENIHVALSSKSSDITATTAKTTGTITGLFDVDNSEIAAIGVAYSTSSSSLKTDNSTKVSAASTSTNTFTITLEPLTHNCKYYYCYYVKQNGKYTYGETMELTTKNVTPSVSLVESSLTATTAKIKGTVPSLSSYDKSRLEFGVAYSTSSSSLKTSNSTKASATLSSTGTFNVSLENLTTNTQYYYCSYVKQNGSYTYGETKDFNTINVTPSVSLVASSLTATTAKIKGTVPSLSSNDKSRLELGVAYSTSSSSLKTSNSTKASATLSSTGTFNVSLENLNINTQYYYCSYVKQNGSYTYGEAKEFNTINVISTVSVVESSITATKATISGMVSNLSDSDKSCLEFGVAYSTSSSSLKSSSSVKESVMLLSDGTFSVSLENLNINTQYYYCSYVKQNGSYTYGEAKEFTTSNPYDAQHALNVASAADLSISGSANCYIVSNAGVFKFKTVKGNSSTSVGNVAFASILWETFGTSSTPEIFDLIKAFCYKDGYIAFQTADTFKEGNAVIAAKDAEGNILWSWHIWLTDQPQEQVYYNNAGTMMDRNLGATSAIPGDVGALGLLYQWGRKDPFLGSSSISSDSVAKSTITWPSAVSSNSSRGTIEYVTANPTTFVKASNSPYDWHYSSRDNTLWTTSETSKSIYDPCPSGWRVPDGGANGIWSKANDSSSSFDYPYNSANKGMNFSGKFGNNRTIWYPASGCRYYSGVSLGGVGDSGDYWSASPNGNDAYELWFFRTGSVYLSNDIPRANGCSVRCVRE